MQLKLVQPTGDQPGIYRDTVPVGHMTELQQHTNESKGLYNMIKSIAANWDGRDPIRGYE